MKPAVWLAPLAVVGATLVAAPAAWKSLRAETDLAARVAAVRPPRDLPQEPCAPVRGPQPLVLLVLGQSNAANHGSPAAVDAARRVSVFVGRGCQGVTDPLPGGTGQGGSIWSRLPAQLQRLGLERPVVIALLAVDASTVQEWSAERGPLAARLDLTLAQLRAARLQPDWVLWQQGEADARAGTPESDYGEGLLRLRARLSAAGIKAPLLAARSTHCKGTDGTAVRAAIARVAARQGDVLMGPDTDTLLGPHRLGDCHFTQPGLDAAAALWAAELARHLPRGLP